MTISYEELQTRPMSTRLVPMIDENNIDVFGVMFQFPNGVNHAWYLKAPAVPLEESVIAKILQRLLEQIISDVRDGNPAVNMKPCRQCFHCTNWKSVTGGLHRMLHDWKDKRIEYWRARSRPASDFAEDPDADTGVDSGWRQPHERKANGQSDPSEGTSG